MAADVSIRITGDSSDLRAELKKVEKNLDAVTDGVQGMTNQARKGMDGGHVPHCHLTTGRGGGSHAGRSGHWC